ncbi:MAG TPA: capsid cement protein [Candidatus Saccharimonadales bacterium]|jgi:hypothetical protein|nr:capsid cement protein [Candidatus Saccharimonadales bacterium]
MSTYSEGRYLTFIADADLSAAANLYKIVSIAASTANTTGRKVVLSTSTTDHLIVGVLNNTPKAGEAASVTGRNSSGTFKVVAGANTASISVGDQLTVDTDSGALKTTTAGDELIGIALEAAVAGQVFEYLPLNRLHA